MPREAGYVARKCNNGRCRHASRSGVLALERRYMTAAKQGRRTRRP